MTHTLLTGLDLSYHASGLPDQDTYLNTAATCLSNAALAALIDEHPIVVHRRTHPGAELTRRVSDCTSECAFRSGRVYRELFVRSTRDFTEADLLTAGSLQPVLALLDTIYSSAPMRGNNGALTEQARTRAHLTVCELDILTLVGDGLSAHQIARLRRISVRTVRKHLEHVYEKLECHDRLLAVNKARHIGLLRSPTTIDEAVKS